MHHVYSSLAEDYKGSWTEQQQVLGWCTPFLASSKGRIVVEDRGGDDSKRFAWYLNAGFGFVTRVKASHNSRRVIDTNGEMFSIQDLSQRLRSTATAERSYNNKKLRKNLYSKVTYTRVSLPELPKVKLNLVLVYTEGFAEPLVILTDRAVDSPAEAWKIFFYYKKRWEIEVFYRAIKQQMGAEKFLIRDFKKIQALSFLIMFAYSLISSLLRVVVVACGGSAYKLFVAFCRRWQRMMKSPLDLLNFFRRASSPYHPNTG